MLGGGTPSLRVVLGDVEDFVGEEVGLRGEEDVFAPPGGVDGGAGGTWQAFDEGGIVEQDGAVGDLLDDGPVIVIALQAEDDGASGCAVQEGLHGLPEGGQIGIGDAAEGDADIGDALLADDLAQDGEHFDVDDAVNEELAEQFTAREVVDQVVEEGLGFFVGGAVDEALGIDDAVQAAQRVQAALLKGGQCEHGFGGGSHGVRPPPGSYTSFPLPRDSFDLRSSRLASARGTPAL